MLRTLAIVGVIYLVLLVTMSLIARSRQKDSKQYLLAGSNVGAVLGLFTFAATLFSTFTLLGMPDFFRVHGVGAWIFLAVSDAVMVFGLITIGHALRKQARGENYYGMSGLIRDRYQDKRAGIIAFTGAFIFLIPYVAIQIRGVAIFLHAAFPGAIPVWGWATAMVVVMLAYSEVGGLKAIIYNDVVQGILLLIAIWIVGAKCFEHFGGIGQMFERVKETNEALLSVPGPKGLFDFQFLLGSMLAICLLPYTQPQVSTRLVIMKDNRSLYRLAVGVGFFAILIILPTAFMGMYGAVLYPGASTSEFLSNTYIADQSNIIASLVMIGLVAAAISTSDSQIFAFGSEMRSLLVGDDQKMLKWARVAIGVFALISLIFALLTSDQLAILARTSFAGTALMAPMILVGIFHKEPVRLKFLPYVTLGAILVFVVSLLGGLPSKVAGIRMDLCLLLLVTVAALVGVRMARPKK